MGFAAQLPAAGGFLEQLEAARSLEDLQAVSEGLRAHYGVDHLVYHWVSASGEQYGCGTYSPDWVQRYIEKGYLRIDPVVQGCFQRFHPVDWKRLDWSSKAARAFQKDAIAHGVGNQGFSIPIRGPNGQFALFTVSHSCPDEDWAQFTALHRRDMILMAHTFNEKALDLEPGRRPEAAQPLSPREIEALTLLAVGYSRAQVAETLAISEHTLRVYVESARFKLGAMNTVHAVARALSRGLIVV
ncbi:autoinducer binding domain-containing protein [Salipiger marinus]|uniref:helix-turn-helix transcriptional regulator n=1 Tax=Salipiger marinus TaxID=555512 RepID=UPI000E8E0D4A|nr:autoinducer binding domain-containing protein [Salipiger manganoxidans]MCD1619781.1 autoinducer binding domain-containing protein [Salipiger manganoxidans]MEB3418392.1 autoinducer binding domain-containing protein [Salipiger manganoxidans]HBM57665.1 LuxR family transcriptional regulator [Citreicella sp.]